MIALIKTASKARLYLAAGLLFGACFPALALFIDIVIMNELPIELDSILYVHIENPLNYIVDLSPFIIGFFSYLLGVNAEKVAFYSRNLEALVDQRTAELRLAKQETDSILDAIDEGLFLLKAENSEFRVGSQQSRATRAIFEVDALPAISFSAVMAKYTPPNILSSIKGFLTLMARPDVSTEMLADLNPLDRAEIHFKGASGALRSKHLAFSFRRVQDAPDFLVSIKDITEKVLLERQLQENERKSAEKTQMLLSILHVGPRLLDDFVEGIEAEMALMQNLLREEGGVASRREAVEGLFRAAHSIKGNAELIDLKVLAGAAHVLEDKLAALRDQEALNWQDFLPVAFQLAQLQEVYDGLKELVSRIQNFQTAGGDRATSAVGGLRSSFEQLVARLAADHGKEIALSFERFDFACIPDGYAYLLRDILVQLLRNSVYHGIETPSERERKGKARAGLIELEASGANGGFSVRYRDDGRSFQFEAIREKVVQTGRALREEAEAFDNARLVRYLFEPGFSTAGAASLTAGRGMGMDIVRQRIKSVGGEMRISYVPDASVEFLLSFPVGAT